MSLALSVALIAAYVGRYVPPSVNFQNRNGFCVLSMEMDAGDQGTTVTFMKMASDDRYLMTFDNASWRSLQGNSIDAELRYFMNPQTDFETGTGLPPAPESDVGKMAVVANKDGSKSIGGPVEREFLKFLSSNISNRMQFALYYQGKPLSDRFRFQINNLKQLDQCTDPFAK